MAEEVAQTRVVVSRTATVTDNAPVTKTFKTGKPIAYTASEGVYVDGTLFKAGEVFVTGKPKGETWSEVDPKDRAAAEAGEARPADIDYDALGLPELKALAATKSINLGEAKSKADVIAVLKAAYEPTL